MTKNFLFLFLILTTIVSCSSDSGNSETNFELNGTSWRGTGETIPERSITFVSSTNYTYIEPGSGGTTHGTYTFNVSSKSGVLSDEYGTVPFFINNSLLTINYNEGTVGYVDTEGIETFIQQ